MRCSQLQHASCVLFCSLSTPPTLHLPDHASSFQEVNRTSAGSVTCVPSACVWSVLVVKTLSGLHPTAPSSHNCLPLLPHAPSFCPGQQTQAGSSALGQIYLCIGTCGTFPGLGRVQVRDFGGWRTDAFTSSPAPSPACRSPPPLPTDLMEGFWLERRNIQKLLYIRPSALAPS